MSAKNSKGTRLALVTALVSGISIFINKVAVGAFGSPLVFTTVKNLIVGVMILTIVVASGKWRLIKSVSKKDLAKLFLIGLVGGSLPFYMFFTGLSKTPAINASIIHKTLVVWVALLAIHFLKEKLPVRQVAGVALLFIGNLFVGGFEGFTFSIGEFLILGATILWAVENIVAKKTLKNVDPDLLTLFRMGFGAIILFSVSIFTVPQSIVSVFQINKEQFFWILLTAVALLAYVSSWYRALRVAPATTVSAVLVSSTLITNVLAAVFVTHSWKLIMAPQSLFILAGLLILCVVPQRKKAFLGIN